VLTLALGTIQIGGAVAFDSLALISDAVHNLSDAVAVLLAVGAAWLAGLPPRGARTFGYRRAEVLAAVVNALLLLALSAGLGYEAITRLLDPQPVQGEGVALISVIAIVLNLIPVLLLLRAGARRNLNANATMLHFASDVLSSFAAFVAGLLIVVTGWEQADPLASLIVVALIVVASLRVLRDAVRVLLEEAPPGIDPQAIGEAIAAVPGVCNVHDLHIWQISDGFPALAAHVIVDPGVDVHETLHVIQRAVAACCAIEHTTIQIDVDHTRGLMIQPRLTQPQEAP
jgi:cobalt-zinc-cadmium efflux system protein